MNDNDIRELFTISRKNSETLIEIMTLLKGQSGSGLCDRVQTLEKRPGVIMERVINIGTALLAAIISYFGFSWITGGRK